MISPRLLAVLVGLVATHVCGAAVPLDQRPANPGEWGYRPADGEVARLNPPTLSWVAPVNAATYDVQMATDPAFPVSATMTSTGLAVAQ